MLCNSTSIFLGMGRAHSLVRLYPQDQQSIYGEMLFPDACPQPLLPLPGQGDHSYRCPLSASGARWHRHTDRIMGVGEEKGAERGREFPLFLVDALHTVLFCRAHRPNPALHLVYPARHLLSPGGQHGALCPRLGSSYIYAVRKLHLAL